MRTLAKTAKLETLSNTSTSVLLLISEDQAQLSAIRNITSRLAGFKVSVAYASSVRQAEQEGSLSSSDVVLVEAKEAAQVLSLKDLSADKSIIALVKCENEGRLCLEQGATAYLTADELMNGAAHRLLRLSFEHLRDLRGQRRFLEGILSSIHDSAWIVSADFETLYMSPSAESIYGLPVDAFVKDKDLWHKLIHPDDQDKVNQFWQDIQVTGSLECEYRILKPDGSVRWLRDRGKAIYEAGKLVRYEGLVSDVTERKDLLQTSREQRAFLQAVIDTNPNTMYVKDRFGRFVLVNKTLADIVKLPIEDIIGKTDLDVHPDPIEAERFRQEDMAILKSGNELHIPEELIIEASGEKRYLQTIKRPMLDEQGRGKYILGVSNDITARKLSELKVEEQKAFLRQVMDTVPNFIFAKDTHGKFTLANQAFAKACGTTVEALLGKTDADVLGSEEATAFQKDDAKVIASLEELIIPEERIVLPSGEVKWRQTIKRPLIGHDGNVQVLGVTTDITKQKQMLEDLARSEAKQKALLQAVPDLIFEYSPEGVYLTYKNNAGDDLFAAPEHFLGKAIKDVLPKEAADLAYKYLSQALEEGEVNFEYPLNDKYYEARMVRTSTGTVLCLVRNMSERIKSEQALKASEQRYRQLFEEANSQKRELELLDKMRSAISQSLDIDVLLTRVVVSLSELFSYDHVGVALKEGGFLNLTTFSNEVSLPKRIPISEGVVGEVARTGEPILIQDVKTDPRFLGDTSKVCSELCVPLSVQDRVIGVLNIETFEADRLSEQDLAMLSRLSGQVAIAIENARLHQQTKKDLARTQALHTVSRIMNTAPTVADLFNQVAKSITDALGARWCLAYRLNANKKEVEHFSCASSTQRKIAAVSYQELMTGLTGWSLHHKEALLSPKGQTDFREDVHAQDLRQKNEVGSIIVAPLIYQDTTLGTLTVLNHLDDPDFNSEDLELMTAIANNLSLALSQRALLDELEHQAYHDSLTGLPNRLLFEDRLEQAIARSNRNGSPFALVFIDLDGFKHVNDTLGHDMGDALLIKVTQRLSKRVRKTDTLARMGGDEFALILNDLREPLDAARVAQSYLHMFKKAFEVQGHELFMTASMGVSLHPDDGKDASSLLKHSDSAMYSAKYSGKNKVESFVPELSQKAHERLALESELRKAIERQELELHYQPQINLATGGIEGVEALLRWQNKTYGFVSPAKFIPIAEDSGLILTIGEWVLEEACRQAVIWQQSELPTFKVAVNISALQLAQPSFVMTVEDVLARTGLDPKWLELEITETVFMNDINRVLPQLEGLSELGIGIALDDFGTGYSSLSYLQKLPLDSLKIDRSFVNDIITSEEDAILISTITSLGKQLGLAVVAEGIETKEQLEFLQAIHCDIAQGYFFAKPSSAKDFNEVIAAMPSLAKPQHSPAGEATDIGEASTLLN